MKKLLLLSVTLQFVWQTGLSQLNNFSVGQTAPNFTVTDIHGNSHSLSDYAGKWVIIDFFAYWCGPCQSIAPILNSFYKKYGCNGYDIIVLGMEGEGTTAQTENFENLYGGDPTYPTPSVSGLDGGGAAVHNTYGPAAFPTIILIGADGLIKNIDIWPISGISTFEDAVTNAGGGSALVVNSCAPANLEEDVITDMRAYPNPSNGTFTLTFDALNNEETTLELFNLVGQRVWNASIQVKEGENSVQLSLPEMKSGTYQLRFHNENGVHTSQIQIQ